MKKFKLTHFLITTLTAINYLKKLSIGDIQITAITCILTGDKKIHVTAITCIIIIFIISNHLCIMRKRLTLNSSFFMTPWEICCFISWRMVNMAMFVFPAPVGAQINKFSFVLYAASNTTD